MSDTCPRCGKPYEYRGGIMRCYFCNPLVGLMGMPAAEAEIADLRRQLVAKGAEIERLREIVERLPKDATGQPHFEFDLLYGPDGEEGSVRTNGVGEWYVETTEGCKFIAMVSDCYPTRAEALAAKEKP